MKAGPSLILAAALSIGTAWAQTGTQPTPGTEPHADGAPGAGPSKKGTKPAKAAHTGTQPTPGTEPHADGAPGAKPAAKKPSKPSKVKQPPTPGTEPHADGAPGAGPKK